MQDAVRLWVCSLSARAFCPGNWAKVLTIMATFMLIPISLAIEGPSVAGMALGLLLPICICFGPYVTCPVLSGQVTQGNAEGLQACVPFGRHVLHVAEPWQQGFESRAAQALNRAHSGACGVPAHSPSPKRCHATLCLRPLGLPTNHCSL